MAFGILILMELLIVIGIPWLVLLYIFLIMLIKNMIGIRKALPLQENTSKNIVMILL